LLELPRKSETKKKRKEDRRRKKNSLHERQARKLLVGCSTNREEDETLALQRNGEIIERGTKKKQQENGTERHGSMTKKNTPRLLLFGARVLTLIMAVDE
jgi:hypothetical protein